MCTLYYILTCDRVNVIIKYIAEALKSCEFDDE